jgi:hypothetical protein
MNDLYKQKLVTAIAKFSKKYFKNNENVTGGIICYNPNVILKEQLQKGGN